MAISLLLICFIGLIFLTISTENVRMSILKGVLFFSVLVLGVTEILSLFKSLNYISILLCWSVIDLIIIYFLIRRKSFNTLSSIKIKLKNSLKSLSGLEKFLIGFSVFLLLGIFVQGLIYPANNWDSMAYHMARIVHWIQNESLAYYRTPVYPQLNSPPFSEQLILNINLLAGNDYFSNVVSLFYLLATSVTVSLVAKYLGLNKFGQILSVFILICIPEVILLGSSTHNEIVVSFFMVSSIYFFIKILKQQAFISFLLLGCSLGLAVATKSTAYIYIGPFVLIWFVVQFYQIITKKQQLKWIYYLVILLSFIVINIGHYSRNYQLTSTIFGTDEVIRDYYVNEEHSIRMMISNVSRNLSNQFGAPKIAPIAQGLTEDLHQLIEVDVNELKFTSHTYGVDPLATHENNGANPYHMVLMLMSCFWFLVFIRKQDKRITVYWIAIVLSFLLFCFYLKWQPWAKLHAPFFIFYAIVLSHFLIHTFKKKLLLNIIVFGFVINALLILIFNYSRPYITYSPYTSTIKITDSRYKKSFSRFLYAYSDYEMVAKKLKEYKLKNIGLMFGDYDLEYQLFIDSYRSDVRPIHINSCMLSEGIPVKYEVDCIVSAKYEDSINYDGETFYNVTKDSDGYLYLFLKQ